MKAGMHKVALISTRSASSVRHSIAGLLIAIAMASAASAQTTATWFGSGSSSPAGGAGTWNTTLSNWSSNGTSWFAWNNTTNRSDTAVFAGTSGTVTLGAAITAGGLRFDTTGYTITGNTLTLSGTAPQLTVASAVTGTIASTITGTGGLTKAGDGTLALASNNTFTGTTTINGGVLRIVNLKNTALGTTPVTINTGTLELATDNYNALGFSTLNDVTVNAGGALRAANPTIKNASNVGTLTLNGGRLESNATTSDGLGNFILRNVIVGGSSQSTIASTNVSVASGTFAFTVNDVTAGTDLLVSAVILGGTTAQLSKTGAGTMELTGSNTYTGGTQINGGVLLLNNAQALSTSGTISFGGGTLQYSAANTADYSTRFSTAANQLYKVDTNGQNVTWATGLTSAAGSLSKLSSGTLTVTGSSTFTGTTSIAGGMLQVGNGSTAGALADASLVSVSSGAALAFNRSNSLTYSGTVSGAGNFEKRGSGLLVLSQNQSYTGTTTITSGTLQLGSGGTTGSIVDASQVINSGVLAFNRSDDLTYSGTVSGVGGLLKSGTNLVSLAGVNTYSGATTVAGGILSLGNANALGGGGNAVFTGGTLQFTSNNTADLSARILNSSSAVAIDTNGQSVTFATALGASNTGGLRKIGSGTLTLTAANAGYTGGTTLDGGVLKITAFRALGTSTASAITINTGTLELALNGDNALGAPAQPVTISAGGALRGAATNAGATNLATLTLNGGRLESNAVDSGLGKFLLRDVVVGGSTQSEISAISVTVVSGSFTVNDVTAGTDLLVSSRIIQSGGGALVKSGGGTMELTGSNSYLPGTTIAAGTLRVNAASALPSGNAVTITNGVLDVNVAQSVGLVTVSGTGTILGAAALTGTSFAVTTAAGEVTLSGTLSGAGTPLVKTGASGLLLTANNTFTGTATIGEGYITVSSLPNRGVASALGSGTTIGLGLDATTGTLRYTGSGETSNRLFVLSGSSGGGVIEANGTGPLSLTGATTAAAGAKTLTLGGTNAADNSFGTLADASGGAATSLLKTGPGRWLLSGSSSYSGSTMIDEGELVLATNAAGSSSNGALGSNANAGITIGSLAGSGTAALLLKQNVLVNSRAFTIPGGTQATVIGALDGSGTATFGSTGNSLVTVGRDLTLQAATGGTLILDNQWAQGSGTSVNITVGSPGNAGTVVLGQPLAATGSVRIDRGIFSVATSATSAGSLAAASAIIVGPQGSVASVLNLRDLNAAYSFGAGQTLSGTGTLQLDADTPVSIAGIFRPGNSPGLFTFDGPGTTTLAGTTIMEITGTTSGTAYDQVRFINGASLNYGSGILQVQLTGTYADNTSFRLFDFAAVSGSFSSISGSGSYGLLTFVRGSDGVWTSGTTSQPSQTIEYRESSGTLVVVPEPATLALAVIGIGAGWMVRRKWRAEA